MTRIADPGVGGGVGGVGGGKGGEAQGDPRPDPVDLTGLPPSAQGEGGDPHSAMFADRSRLVRRSICDAQDGGMVEDNWLVLRLSTDRFQSALYADGRVLDRAFASSRRSVRAVRADQDEGSGPVRALPCICSIRDTFGYSE